MRRLLAFLDPLLGCAPLVIKPHYRPARQTQIRDDEADSREQLPESGTPPSPLLARAVLRDGNIYLRGVYSKNKKAYYVPIVGELVQLIERRKEARSIKTDSGVLLSSLVFHRAGKPIAEFRKSWATACKKAGCEGRIFHDLRRSAARQLIRSGVTKDVARQLGGWKTDSMFSRYNVCDEEDLRDAIEKVTKYNETESQKIVQIAK